FVPAQFIDSNAGHRGTVEHPALLYERPRDRSGLEAPEHQAAEHRLARRHGIEMEILRVVAAGGVEAFLLAYRTRRGRVSVPRVEIFESVTLLRLPTVV